MGATHEDGLAEETFYLVVEENRERLPMAGFDTEEAAQEYLDHLEAEAEEEHIVCHRGPPWTKFKSDSPGGTEFYFRIIEYPFNPDVED